MLDSLRPALDGIERVTEVARNDQYVVLELLKGTTQSDDKERDSRYQKPTDHSMCKNGLEMEKARTRCQGRSKQAVAIQISIGAEACGCF